MHVTGSMKDAGNIINISSFSPKTIFLNGKFTDPAFMPSIVQFECTHFSEMYFSVFAAQNLNLRFIFFLWNQTRTWSVVANTSDATGNHPLGSFLRENGRHLQFANNWMVISILWVDKTIRKDCSSNVSSHFLGRCLAWGDAKRLRGRLGLELVIDTSFNI